MPRLSHITKDDLAAAYERVSRVWMQFPFQSGSWTNHTAEVVDAALPMELPGKLVINAVNNRYRQSFYYDLDTSRVSPDCKHPEEQEEKNKASLLTACIALDLISVDGEGLSINASSLQKAIGKIITFGVVGLLDEDGNKKIANNGRQKTFARITGNADALLPVRSGGNI